MRKAVVVLALVGGGLAVAFFWPSRDGVVERAQAAQFAADRAKGEVKALPFDGDRAMKYLKAICDIGPRMSGTEGMKKQQELIKTHFEEQGFKVQAQNFMGRQVSRPTPIEMTNLIVSLHPDRTRRVILCSHYDTRPIADQEPDPKKWRETFVSANDGGSGVAFLMEIARHLKDLPGKVGVDLVFFDGEEYIFESKRDEYFIGSKHFAQTWKRSKNRPDYIAAVLLDMIAGKDARFPVEGYSFQRARDLCLQVWGEAKEQRVARFLDRLGDRVQDDHLSLLNAGIPAIDIIDFEYPHWHRLSDTPDNCAPDGMIDVAKVLGAWLQRMK